MTHAARSGPERGDEPPPATDLRLGPLRDAKDPALTGAESSVLAAFADLHLVSKEKIRCASLLDPDGAVEGIVIVAPMEVLRELARSTGKWVKTDPPVFERDAEGLPAAATVRVFRTDLPRGLARTAFWHERLPSSPEEPGAMRWMTEPDTVLSEIAESLALRGAFPQALEGVYTEADLSEAVRDHALARVHARSELQRQLGSLR